MATVYSLLLVSWLTAAVKCRTPGIQRYVCKESPEAFGCNDPEQLTDYESKAIGSGIVKDCQWPSVVRIEHKCVLICTGSILSKNWILTAARCVDEGSPEEYIFTAGEPAKDYSASREQRTIASKIVLHPEYERTAEVVRKNDIALVQVKPELYFTECVGKANLPKRNYFEIGPSYFIGWGSYSAPSPSTDPYVLQSVEIGILCEKKCRRLLGGGIDDKLEKNMFCTYESDGRGPFAQDSGGPLFFFSPNISYEKMAMQVGVFSWNLYQGTPYPAVYMRVSAYIQWIEQTIT